MARSTLSINSFTGGELTPAAQERTNLVQHANGCRRMRNFIALPWGGATLRPGRLHVAEAKESDKLARLLEFEFSTEQAYAIEAGDGYLRFFRNKGQIVVDPTDAAISNGSFDNDLADWDDVSSGGGLIRQVLIGGDSIDLLRLAQIASGQAWGDNLASRANVALKFPVSVSGDVATAAVQILGINAGFNAVARIYTDNGGSPGVQVGSDSQTETVDTEGVLTFTWLTKPAVTAATTYWLVLSDVTADGTGYVVISQCADQGGAYASGYHDTITSITNNSGGWSSGRDLRAKVQVETANSDGALGLEGNGVGVAAAEQDVVTTDTGQEHVLRFRIIGLPADKATLRIGNTSEGDQVLTEMDVRVGFHVVAFTPDASPFYVQFRNADNKTLYIDDVELLGSGAGSAVPLEIGSPYAAADLRSIQYAGSADVLYLVAPDYRYRKLGRFGNSTWFLSELDLIDGPYLDENGDPSKTLKPSSTNNGTITAAGHAPFKETDVGRLVRIKHSGTWGAARIREVLSPESVKVEQLPDLDFAAALGSAAWQLGLYSDTTGFPQAVTIYEQRLCFAGCRTRPSRIDGSRSLGDYEDFTPGADDSHAVAYNIGSSQVNAIRWLAAGRALLGGTSNAEFRLSGSTTQAALTPTNVIARAETKEGVAGVRPISVSDVVLFVQRQRQRLHELAFSFEVGADGGFTAPDISILAEHLLQGQVVDICYQKAPWSIVWMCLADGRLVGMTYNRAQEVIALHVHPFSDGAAVEAVASIPGDGNDELWLIVRRKVNGTERRCVERLADPLRREDPQEDGIFVDGGLSLDNTVAATLTPAAVSGSGVTFTAGSGVFSSGDVGRVIKYRWTEFDEEGDLIWRRARAEIVGYTSPTVVTADIQQDFPSTDTIPADGWRLTVTTVSGADHLEGQMVQVVGDGAYQGARVVAGGSVEVDPPAATVHIGSGYRGLLVPTRPAAGARRGSAQGMVARVGSMVVSLDRSAAVKAGRSLSRLETIPTRRVEDPMDDAPPLFTGLRNAPFPGDYDRETDLYLVQDLPLPATILAVYPDKEVNEG